MNLFNLFGNKSFPHGTHPDEYKEATKAKVTRRLSFPSESIDRPAPVYSLDVPMTKGTGALLVLDKRATKKDEILRWVD